MKIAIIFFIGFVAFTSAQNEGEPDQYLPEQNEVNENVPEVNEVSENVPELNEVNEMLENLENQDNGMSEVEDVIPKNRNNQEESKQLCKEAKLYRNPEDCGTFYSCAIGHYPYLMDCPTGLRFNEKLKVCDWPQNVQC
ncbi:hypothetical protein TKK_0010698 [Trichogramma kaykai]|uniref:Chitin-binding type-2 domain-containing protein n=1 Tax=Trichogramma kaykai TaxID=54128 RepID=A0ABD2WVU9_9HYME